MHERHLKCHPPGDFSPADIWESEGTRESFHHLAGLSGSAALSPSLFKLYVCFYVLAFMLGKL